jgi:hypothetical protein
MPRDVRAMQNMRFFRDVNEGTERIERMFTSDQRIAFTCECSELGCRAPVYLTAEEFRLVRAIPGHYVVVPDHVNAAFDRVVGVAGDYVVVANVEVPEAAPDVA